MSENKVYNVEEIMKLLPHRYPFLLVDRLTVEANKCGFKGFKATYKAFKNSMRQGNSSHGLLINPTDFPQQPLELECGEWHCDSTGVSKVLKDKVFDLARLYKRLNLYKVFRLSCYDGDFRDRNI